MKPGKVVLQWQGNFNTFVHKSSCFEYSWIFNNNMFENNTECSTYNVTGETQTCHTGHSEVAPFFSNFFRTSSKVRFLKNQCQMSTDFVKWSKLKKDADTETSSEVWVQGFAIKFHIQKFATVQNFVTSVWGYIWNYFVLH